MTTRRPQTTFLDAWQRAPAPVGTPLHRAASWERSALLAWEQGCAPETIVHDLAEARRIAREAGLTVQESTPPDRRPQARRPARGDWAGLAS